jgi:type II restriction enzyme
MLRHEIKESETVNLSTLWNFSDKIAHTTVIAEKKKCFIGEFDIQFLSAVGLSQNDFDGLLLSCIERIRNRGYEEIDYWETERKIILSYSREQAITELIRSKKIDEKIRQIDFYIRGISRD